MNPKPFSFERLEIDGVYRIFPFLAEDPRGVFIKDYSDSIFKSNGLDLELKEVFYSQSKKGVLRGIHFQRVIEQDKLVRCLSGLVYDVVVDLRPASPTFGKWLSFFLSPKCRYELFIPKGCGHGFLAIKKSIMSYKCSEAFNLEYDDGIRYDDPTLGIRWPFERIGGALIISEKDQNLPSLKEFLDQKIRVGR